MTDTRHRNLIMALVVNAVIAADVLYNTVTGVLYGASSSQPGDGIIGLGYFRPFTMDSNVFAGISSLIMVIYLVRKIRDESKEPDESKESNRTGTNESRWVMDVHLMAATSLFLTLLTVAFFLAPRKVMAGKSYFLLFEHDLFFYHFLNPLLAIISFGFLCKDHTYTRRERLIGVIPMTIYTCVYLMMVIVLKKWRDFYGFTFGGKLEIVPIVLIVMFAVVYLLSTILVKLHNR